MQRLRGIIERGLTETAALWGDIDTAYRYVNAVARTLRNEKRRGAAGVRRAMHRTLGAFPRCANKAGRLRGALEHFAKVTRSFLPGLFFCYEVEGLERTNNDLERYFGSWRHHERRATGRKSASRSVVLRGPASLPASAATRLRRPTPEGLVPADIKPWKRLRAQIEARKKTRGRGRAFRRDPDSFLRALEEKLGQPILPS